MSDNTTKQRQLHTTPVTVVDPAIRAIRKKQFNQQARDAGMAGGWDGGPKTKAPRKNNVDI